MALGTRLSEAAGASVLVPLGNSMSSAKLSASEDGVVTHHPGFDSVVSYCFFGIWVYQTTATANWIISVKTMTAPFVKEPVPFG